LIWAALVKAPSVVPTTDHWPSRLVQRICHEADIPRHRGQRDAADHPWEVVTALAVEKPIIYTDGEARPSDVVDLREIYGACMAGIDADYYFGPQPGEWKGSVPEKRIMNERILNIINPGEKTILIQSEANGTGGMSDHVIDAVGIGLFTLGRMWKGGIKPS
jgi:hypothetical protein